MLDYRIETFLTVCQTMNFTRAAELLHITQPAVSQHIKFLEKHYQARLFSVDGKHLLLTDQGQYLYRTMSTIKHDEKLIRSSLQDLMKQPKKLHLGATMTIGEFDIQKKVLGFLKEHPNFKLNYEIADTKVLLQKLDTGAIDFAVIEGNFDRNSYDYKVYKKENFIPICATNFPFGKTPQKIEDLLGVTLIVREEGSGTREILEHYLHEYNLSLHDFANVVEINNMNIIREAVKSGCGISFLYEPIVKEDLRAKEIQVIPLQDYRVTHDFTFIWSKGSIHKEWYMKICEYLE